MKFVDVLKVVGDVAMAITKHQKIVELLRCDRQVSMNLITQFVRTVPSDGLALWETEFLEYTTTTIVDPEQRRRAMELYAWFKIEERARNGRC